MDNDSKKVEMRRAAVRRRRARAEPIPANMRARVLARDGFICQYCGKEADEVDHLVPVSRATERVKAAPGLLVAACRSCNRAKGNAMLTEKAINYAKGRIGNGETTGAGFPPIFVGVNFRLTSNRAVDLSLRDPWRQL